ncbi:hypothetical protein CDD83_3282 [Cordyceps sp. RAO-2017]|nr:hypothetical protein CDD83_3282 [Cordyceps sp. RAO-2017]
MGSKSSCPAGRGETRRDEAGGQRGEKKKAEGGEGEGEGEGVDGGSCMYIRRWRFPYTSHPSVTGQQDGLKGDAKASRMRRRRARWLRRIRHGYPATPSHTHTTGLDDCLLTESASPDGRRSTCRPPPRGFRPSGRGGSEEPGPRAATASLQAGGPDGDEAASPSALAAGADGRRATGTLTMDACGPLPSPQGHRLGEEEGERKGARRIASGNSGPATGSVDVSPLSLWTSTRTRRACAGTCRRPSTVRTHDTDMWKGGGLGDAAVACLVSNGSDDATRHG